MKYVYVVTEGSYSDYGITACFSSREAAEKYMERYSNGQWWRHEWNDIEVFPLIEEVADNPQTCVSYCTELSLKTGEKRGNVYFSMRKEEWMEVNPTEIRIDEWIYEGSKRKDDRAVWITLNRKIDPKYFEPSGKIIEIKKKQLLAKYEKVTQDLFAEIKSLMEVEGWSKEMVEDYYRGKRDSTPLPKMENVSRVESIKE